MEMTHVELDPEMAKTERLIWCAGTPYDPPGYYMVVEFKGRRHYILLTNGGKPEDSNEQP